MIKYNEKYDRWVTDDGLVYREDKQHNRILCKPTLSHGYLRLKINKTSVAVHRMVWETFNGDIPKDFVIDHLDTDKTNNKLKNLKCCTTFDNINNLLTIVHRTESLKGRIMSVFGQKFFEHYGITKYQDIKLYRREYAYFYRNGKCSWE